MAIRKPRTESGRSPRPAKIEPMDLSSIEVFRPTPEQIADQMVKLKEFLDEWEAEMGPFTEQDFEDIERAWPGSR